MDHRDCTSPTSGAQDALPDRPATSMSISSQNEVGSGGMMSFFRAHMTSILQPFADNVEELHKMVFNMTDTILELRTRIDANSSAISEQGAQLTGVRADLQSTSQLLASTKASLETTIAEKAELEAAVKNFQLVSKQTLSKVDTVSGLIQHSIDELKSGHEKTGREIVKLQKMEKEVKSDISRNNDSAEKLKGKFEAIEKRSDKIEEALKSNKLSFDNHVVKAESLLEEQKERLMQSQVFSDESQKQFREFENKIIQSRAQMLQQKAEANQTHNDAVHALSTRLDAHEKMLSKVPEKFQQIDSSLNSQQKLVVSSGENTSKLIKLNDEKRAAEIQGIRNKLDVAAADTSKHARMISDLQDIVQGKPPDSSGKHTIQLLQEDMKLSMRRESRLEQILGLDPLSKDGDDCEAGLTLKNGILLTNAQIEDFQKTFEKFDSDGSGHISTGEVAEVLKSLGHEVDLAVVQLIVKEIDHDRSGEINFDEFCSMMSKILGPDGSVDVDGYLGQLSEAAKREAKQNQVADLLPVLKEEVDKLGPAIQQEQSKLQKTSQRVQNLEGDHAALVAEVQKLRKGLNANNEYWKGLSQGLKETKKHVYQEGEGEMLPSVMKLRNLPPLDARPATHQGISSAR
eukprot:gnl/TRDRNA2_/TRDRNA2_163651_c0_seq1.p1 gnl/TRDRNA2_/TRDRNA2_163651_c0~~gnl/TRDRNA2_/TRDRNA2_163651_c0_seq1.p1  ORF type:complete len:652 (-),score=180.81 gnl/TRDRNA2_/TRDRNA2_163651_c0_seq1:14-1900(-)